MATTFNRSVRSLVNDGYRHSVGLILLSALLLVLWVVWFFGARVKVYAVTEEARLEVEREVHPVESGVEGRVITTNLVLGKSVKAGDLIVELDSSALELDLGEHRVRIAALASQLEVLQAELMAEEEVLDQEKGMTSAVLAEARAREREARVTEQFARDKAQRWRSLASGGVVSGVDGMEAEAESLRLKQEVDTLRLGTRRLRQERQTRITTQLALLNRLRREQAELQGQIATTRATIDRLEHDIDAHRIRAPVDGRLGLVTPLKIGSVVEAGEELGAIVPEGEIRAVAFFTPAQAAGRLKSAQPARIRLDGFPWTQFGSLGATVTTVATEPQQGRIRVELILESQEFARIPLEHGLPGSAEVEVERTSPASLVLRAAGRLLTHRFATTRPLEELRPR